MGRQRQADQGPDPDGARGGQRPISALHSDSRSAQVYRRIREDLLLARHAPGEALRLRDIAGRLGVSVTPVREGLAGLVAQGILQQEGHHSIRVPSLNRAQFDELRILRMELEGLAAQEAAERAVPADIERLSSIQAQFAAAAADGQIDQWLHWNIMFHRYLYSLASRPTLSQLIEYLWLRVIPIFATRPALTEDQGRRVQHDLVLDALREGNPAAARSAVISDIDQTSGFILDMLDGGRLPRATPSIA